MRLDLHVHSVHSPDGVLSIEAIAREAEAAGLDGFALTDHNSIDGLRELEELALRNPSRLFLPGVEVSTREGHLLVYGLRELPPIGASVEATIDWARARGAACAIAHPFRWAHGVGGRVARSSRADAVEVVNGHTGARANSRALGVARARRLGAIAGSDAHRPGEVARAFTVFPDSTDSPGAALSAIAEGRTTASGRSARPLEVIAMRVRSALARGGRGLRPI